MNIDFYIRSYQRGLSPRDDIDNQSYEFYEFFCEQRQEKLFGLQSTAHFNSFSDE